MVKGKQGVLTIAQRLGEKHLLYKSWAVKNSRKVPVRNFKRQERGLTFFEHVSDSLISDHFPRFSNHSSYQIKNVLEPISCCRRASLGLTLTPLSRAI